MPAEKGSLSLTQLAGVVRRRWAAILGAGVLFAAGAGVYRTVSTIPYEATASVILVRSRLDIRLDERFRTVGDEELSSGDMRARRQALFDLVKTHAVAREVIRKLHDRLAPGLREPSALMARVRVTMPGRADLIHISCRNEDARLAADLASAWASGYVRHVNETYSDAAQYLQAVRRRLEEARESYRQVQKELEQYILDSRIAELERKVADREKAVRNLQQSNDAWVTALTERIDAEVSALQDLYALLRRTEQLLEATKGMRQQVRSGGPSAASSNALALCLLKTRAFAGGSGFPEGLQIEFSLASSRPSATEVLTDLDALVSTLQRRREATLARIEKASNELLQGPGEMTGGAGGSSATSRAAVQRLVPPDPYAETAARLEAEVRGLRHQLESQEAAKRQLEQQRDRARDLLDMLRAKQAELEVSEEAMGNEVRLASTAAVPRRKVSSGVSLVVFAGFGGLLLGLVVSLVTDRK